MASVAYVLLCALRRIALKHTQFAKANCATIRLKLLKIGALVRVSIRRIKLAMARRRTPEISFKNDGLPSSPRQNPPRAPKHQP